MADYWIKGRNQRYEIMAKKNPFSRGVFVFRVILRPVVLRLVALLFITGCATTADYEDLLIIQEELQKKYDELFKEYERLNGAYEQIQTERALLKETLEKSEVQVQVLATEKELIATKLRELEQQAIEAVQKQSELRAEIENISKEVIAKNQQNQRENVWRAHVVKATEAYDRDDYVAALREFEKAIASGCGDGIVWYRFAYSNERVHGLTEEIISLFRIAHELLKRQYSGHRYVGYTQKKLDLFFISSDTQSKKNAVLKQILLEVTLKQAETFVFPRIGVEVTYNEETKEVYVKFLTPNTYEVDTTNVYGRWRDNQWAVLQVFKNSNILVHDVTVETNLIDTDGFMKFAHSAHHVDQYAKLVEDEPWFAKATSSVRMKESDEWELIEQTPGE